MGTKVACSHEKGEAGGQMAQRGGKRPGAGRKSNAQKAAERDALLARLGDGREQVERWFKLLATEDSRVLLSAMIYLTNRAYGRPIAADIAR